MKEINFYCIEDEVNAFLYSFLSKLIEKGKRVMIYSESPEKMERLDGMLWSIKKVGFLPHLLYNENGAQDTPVVISNEKDNRNNANFLLISTFLDDDKFLDNFEKTFYVFSPANLHLIDEAEKNWEKYKKMNFNTKLFRKSQDGKWTEFENFNLKNILNY